MKQYFFIIILLALMLLTLTGCKKESKETQKEGRKEENKQEVSIVPEDKDTVNTDSEGASHDQKEDPVNFVLKNGTVVSEKMESVALADNLAREKITPSIYIYLPPTYHESEKRYPVIYYLHGYGESAMGFIDSVQNELDQAFSKDSSKEFILVAVEGASPLGGSFYVNSPVIGKWEDYTSKEVVSYVDKSYKTIANANSRGICGFSMGGFGALNLAFLHPDVYGAVYSMSPGVLAPGKIGDALDSWEYDISFLKAYSMAFAYNTKEPYDTTPLRDGSKKDNELIKRWESGFGNWEEKIKNYQKKNKPLISIGMLYGTSDSYKWIPQGTEYLSSLLNEKGIKHSLISVQGGHNIPFEATTNYILPFFQKNLYWE